MGRRRLAAAAFVGFGAACSSAGGLGGSGDGGMDAGPAVEAGLDAAEAAPAASVRLANWSPDAPAVDVCLGPAGFAWAGTSPLLGPLLPATGGPSESPEAGPAGDAGDGGSLASLDAGDAASPGDAAPPQPPGAAFLQVTRYFDVAPGAYAVRIVRGGAQDCSTGLLDIPSVMLSGGVHATLAVMGGAAADAGDPGLQILPFADDVSAPPGEVALRFINASASASDGMVDFGTGAVSGAGGTFSDLFTAIGFGTASRPASTDAGSVDANGYLQSLPLGTATVSAHVTTMAANDLVVALDDVTVPAQTAATVILAGRASRPVLLQCPDEDEVQGVFTGCTLVSQ